MEAADYSRRGLPAETRSRITEKLVHGRESTVRLQFLLRSPMATEHDRQALAAEILSSFTEAISVLDSSESAGDESTCPDHSLCSDLDSGNSRQIPPVKDLGGRGNKRRKLANSRVVTSASTEDNHAWRKYGQKVILNATHPRNYFRCTHKYDQGCKATKQVQKMEGNSGVYKITYINDHTCGPTSTIVAVDAVVDAADSYNICFSQSCNDQLSESTVTGRFVWPSNDDNIVVKGETTSGVTTDDMDQCWSELKDFGSLVETTATTTMNQYFWDELLQ